MEYYQYTDPDSSCRTYFCCFPLALANIRPWPLSNSKPPTTIPFGIVACTFSDNLSRNSCILSVSWRKQFCVNCQRAALRRRTVSTMYNNYFYYTLYSRSVVSLARLLSYMPADYWLLCRLGAQCMISN